MSAFSKLDQWITDRVFQPIVDASGRKPLWWGRHAACAAAALWTVRVGLNGFDVYGVIVVATMTGLAAVVHVISDAAYAATVWPFNRWLPTAGVVLWIARLFMGSDPDAALYALCYGALAAVNFFATCRPPRPSEPKGRFVHGGAL